MESERRARYRERGRLLAISFVRAILMPAAVSAAVATPTPAVLSVETNVDKSSYSWFGNITVTAYVTENGSPVPDCDSVVVTCPANAQVRAHLADDGVPPDIFERDGRYAGYFRAGGELGEARPIGDYTLDATAYRDDLTGTGTSPVFSLYSVRRWTGITTGSVDDPYDEYTGFFAEPDTVNGGWHHTITDFGLVRSWSAVDALIRIPVLPQSNTITNLSVSGSGVSNVAVHNNVIEFVCDLTGASVTRVSIEFDAPGDLAATFIDRYYTGDMGRRDFRNGYLVWNRYIHTGILGSDFSSPHGPGCIVDLHVADLETGAPHTVDCMERVAVHLDDEAHNDGTGTYPSNVKWTGDSITWLDTADLETMTFVMSSGGAYGLRDRVSVTRTVQFMAGSRMFRHHYVVRNIDDLLHDFDFIWGREQWLYGSGPGSNRQEDDRGMLPNDPTTYGGEYGFAPQEIDGNWFAAYDRTSFYTLAVILADRTADEMPTYSYFLCDPPLTGNTTGEYPVYPSGTCSNMANTFFERRIGILAPGDSATYEFFQWGGYAADRESLTDLLWRDAVTVSHEPLVLDVAPAGDGVPIDTAIDVWFNNPMDHATTEGALVITPDIPVGGTCEWFESDRHLRFRPADMLEAETVYTVELLRNATDTSGRSLATKASWEFRTSTEVSDVLLVTLSPALYLDGASPNPFRRETTISFSVPERAYSRLTLYDANGRRVRILMEGMLRAGRHTAEWEGTDERGWPVAAGVYFCRLQCADRAAVRKVVLER